MVRAATRTDILWGYIAQALNIGAGIILLPIILRYLPPVDVGLWFVFVTLAGLAQMLEFGFQPTIARNSAYIYAGAQSLQRSGLPDRQSEKNGVNVKLLADLVDASKRIYRIVALLASIVLLFGGTCYIYTILTPAQNVFSSVGAWVCFAAGYIATFYFGYINGLLQGRGDVTSANKVSIITRGSLILLGSAAVIAGYGLLGLGISSLISAVIGRWFANRFYYSAAQKEELKAYRQTVHGAELIKTLWHNASRLGVVQIGAFLIQRANILIASSFLGLSIAASYSMTLTVLMVIGAVSMVICNIHTPHMNALQAEGKQVNLQVLYGEILILAWGVYVAGFFTLFFLGQHILRAIGSKTSLLPGYQLLMLGLICALELNHSIAATYLTTTNKVPFLNAALLSGISILILSLCLVNPVQITGLIIAQGLVQLFYNNWKWPVEAMKHLHSGHKRTLSLGFNSLRQKITSRLVD